MEKKTTQEIIDLLEECRDRIDNRIYGENITEEEFRKLEDAYFYVCEALNKIA